MPPSRLLDWCPRWVTCRYRLRFKVPAPTPFSDPTSTPSPILNSRKSKPKPLVLSSINCWAAKRTRLQKGPQFRQRVDRSSGRISEFLGNLTRTPEPECVKTRRAGAIHVPIVRGDKTDFCLIYFEIGRQSIVNTRTRLEYLDAIYTEDVIDQVADARALDRRGKHLRFAVREDGESQAD